MPTDRSPFQRRSEVVPLNDSLLFDQVNDAIIVVGMDLLIQRWNQGAQTLYGWPAAEVIGKNFSTTVPSVRYLEGSLDEANATVRREGTWRGMVVQLHRDGHELFVESSVRLLRDADGQPIGMIAINRDVTERMELIERERQARSTAEAAARRQQVLSNVSAAFVADILDLEAMLATVVRVVSEVIGDFCAMLLLSSDKTTLLPGPASHHLPFAQQFVKELAELQEPLGVRQAWHVVTTGQSVAAFTLDGAALRQSMHPMFYPYYDAVGISSLLIVPMRTGLRNVGTLTATRDRDRPPYTPDDLALLQDIADRAGLAIENAQLHQDAQTTLARLSTVLATAPVGICFWDQQLVYTQLNDAFAVLAGGSVAALVGRPADEVPSNLTMTMLPLLRHTLQSGEPHIDQEISGVPPGTDGPERFWLWSCYAIHNAEGLVAGVGAVVIETTQRRQLEAQLLTAQRMESLGRLAGGIAHDFNNLLTAIIGYADLAIGDLPPALPVIDDLEEIKRAAERAATLTRQLLAFARRSIITPRTIDLNGLIADVEKLLRRLIGPQIDLVLHLDPQLAVVRADPGQIEQVLVNLVVNARDAMPAGGHLTITTANVALDARLARRYASIKAGNYVQITVIDTGIGMDQQTQLRAFEPFFTTKPQGEGTGLGLSTCYGIVKQHGGSIWITSKVGQGTTVSVYLPEAPGVAADVTPTPPTTAVPHGSETILLVEDEEVIRTLAARALRSHGYTVIEASNGNEALSLVAAHQPQQIDLLLTDVMLPGINARHVATTLTQRYPALKVLYTSGYAENVISQQGEFNDDLAFLPKPFTPSTLLRAVRSLLDTKQE